MKVSELLLDLFLETPLFEMAYSRHEAWVKCDGLVTPLTERILKVLVMPSSTYVKHWTNEIYSYLSTMDKIKPNSKRLSTGTYKEWLITKPEFSEADIQKDIADIQVKYPGEKVELYDGVFDDYQRVMRQLCVDLGQGVIDRAEVAKYLTELKNRSH